MFLLLGLIFGILTILLIPIRLALSALTLTLSRVTKRVTNRIEKSLDKQNTEEAQKVKQGVQKTGRAVQKTARVGAGTVKFGVKTAKLATKLAIKALKLAIKALKFLIWLIKTVITVLVAIVTFIISSIVIIVIALVAAAAGCILLVMSDGWSSTIRNSTTADASTSDSASTQLSKQELQNWLKNCESVWNFYIAQEWGYDDPNGTHEIDGVSVSCQIECSGYVRTAIRRYTGNNDTKLWDWFSTCPDYNQFVAYRDGKHDADDVKGVGGSATLTDEQLAELHKYFDMYTWEDYKAGKYQPQAGDIMFFVGGANKYNGSMGEDRKERKDLGEHVEIYAGTYNGSVYIWGWGDTSSSAWKNWAAKREEIEVEGVKVQAAKNWASTWEEYTCMNDFDTTDGQVVKMYMRLKGTGASGGNEDWNTICQDVYDAICQDDCQWCGSYSVNKLPHLKEVASKYGVTVPDTFLVQTDCNGLFEICCWIQSGGTFVSGNYPDNVLADSGLPSEDNGTCKTPSGKVVDLSQHPHGGAFDAIVAGKTSPKISANAAKYISDNFELHKGTEEGFTPQAGDVCFRIGHVEIYMGKYDGKDVKLNAGTTDTMKNAKNSMSSHGNHCYQEFTLDTAYLDEAFYWVRPK